MKYVRLIGINLLVLCGLLFFVAVFLYYKEANRINTFFSFTTDFQAQYYIPDSTAMFIHKPNIHIYDNWGTPQQKISTERRTNNLGFRDDDDVTDKKSNEIRVLVTGDSHTDGVLKHNTESFINVWEKRLNIADSTSYYNCINGGVGYYSFRNYHGFLKKYAYLQPDVYLINVFTGNDFREAGMYEDNRINMGNMYRNTWMHFRRKFQSAAEQEFPYIQGIEQMLYFQSFPDQKEKAINISQKYLLQIIEICKQKNIRLIVTLLPSKIEVNPEFQEQIKTLFDLDDETLAINTDLTQTLVTFLQEQQVEYYDLLPPLYNPTEKVYWDEDLHINPKGHEIIGHFLFDKVDLK